MNEFAYITATQFDARTVGYTLTLTCVAVLIMTMIWLMQNPEREPARQHERAMLLIMTMVGSFAGVLSLFLITS